MNTNYVYICPPCSTALQQLLSGLSLYGADIDVGVNAIKNNEMIIKRQEG